jgi:transposase
MTIILSHAEDEKLKERGRGVVIPPRGNCKNSREYGCRLVECFFNQIERFRRVATHYEKLAKTYLAMVTVAAVIVRLT